MSVTTYLNDNAQTPLGRFVSLHYTTNVETNTVTNRTDEVYALGILYRTYNVDRRR